MMTLDKPVNESKRLSSLRKYQILDTPSDGNFDRITELAANIFNVPIAIISLVDTDRIWFKSHHGIPVKQIDRDPGLCASAILSDDLYIVENARNDPRCLANPLVAGDFGLQFYAAAPLQTEENYNLGTFCIIDKIPRVFSKEERVILKQLGGIVMDEMNLRLAIRETSENIKNITADIAEHLQRAADNMQRGSQSDLISYLDASRIYLQNVQNQMNNL